MVKALSIDWDKLYDKGNDYRPVSVKEIELYVAHLSNPEQQLYLDIGCGTGQLTREMYHRGLETTGIDPSASAIRLAQARTTRNILYAQQDLHNFRLENRDQKYDVITCRLAYAFIADKKSFLQAIKSSLTTKGKLFILTPVIERTLLEKAYTAIVLHAELPLIKQYFTASTEEVEELVLVTCTT